MQVKSIVECSKAAILSTFIKLIKIFVLSIFEWPFYTGITVLFYPRVFVTLTFLDVFMYYASPIFIKLTSRIKQVFLFSLSYWLDRTQSLRPGVLIFKF